MTSFSDYNRTVEWLNYNKSVWLNDATAKDFPSMNLSADLGAEAYIKLAQLQVGFDLGYLASGSSYKSQSVDNDGDPYTFKESWSVSAVPVGATVYFNPVLGLLVGAGGALYFSSLHEESVYTNDYGTTSTKFDLSATSLGLHASVGYIHRVGNFGVGAMLVGRFAKIKGYTGRYTYADEDGSTSFDVQLGFEDNPNHTGYILREEGAPWEADERDGEVDFSGVGLRVIFELGI